MFGSNTNTTNTSSNVQGKNYKQIGEDGWRRAEKMNGDLFALTYGCLVASLYKDTEDATLVNTQLDKLGHAMGIRIIDEFLARNPDSNTSCQDFKETGEMVRVAFRQFLGTLPTLTTTGVNEFVLAMTVGEDALGSEYVELPEQALKGGLHYSQLLCGVIKGALEMVRMEVECNIIQDPLLTPSTNSTEFKVKLVRMLEEELPPNEE